MSFGNIASAAPNDVEPGLLRGMLPTSISYPKFGTKGDPAKLTDGDSETGIVLHPTVTYTFPSPVDIRKAYIKASNGIQVRFYDSNVNAAGAALNTGRLVTEYDVQAYGVKTVVFQATNPNYTTFYELELYELANPNPSVWIDSFSATKDSITLNFSGKRADEYEIYVDGRLIEKVSNSPYVIKGLSSYTTYKIKVVGRNEHGEGAADLTVTTSPEQPSLSATEVLYNKVRLTFSAPKANLVELFRDGVSIRKFESGETQFTDTVEPSKVYRYWVKATYRDQILTSENIQVKTPELPAPLIDEFVTEKVTSKAISVAFKSRYADKILVYKDGILVDTLPGDATKYSFGNLAAFQEYRLWIVAENNSGKAASAILTVKAFDPAKVTNLRAIEKKTNRIKFAWDQEPTADKYKIEIVVTHNQTAALDWTAGEAPTTTTTLESTTNQVDVKNLKPGERVDVAVSLINSAFGVHGTARITETVPTFDIPDFGGGGGGNPGNGGGNDGGTPSLFTPNDLFESSVSLVSNFWPFLLLGLSFIVAPWFYSILVKAAKKPKPTTDSSNKREVREQYRDIRLALRKGETNG